MELLYTEVGLVHADEDSASDRPDPRTLDEVLGHPTPAYAIVNDSDQGEVHSSIDREIFGFLVTP